MPSYKMKHKEFCAMVAFIIKKAKEFFAETNHETIKITVNDLERVGNEFLESDKQVLLEQENLRLFTITNDEKRDNTIYYLKKLIKSIELIYDDESEAIITKLGFRKKSFNMSQDDFNELVKNIILHGKEQFANNPAIMEIITKLDEVGNDYLSSDLRHEQWKDENVILNHKSKNLKADTTNVLKKLEADIIYVYGKESDSVFKIIGYHFKTNNKKKESETPQDDKKE